MRINSNIAKVITTVIGAGIIYISVHLSLGELTVTQTGIPNNVTDTAIINNLTLVADSIYEPCRRHFGRAIYISSAYRNYAVNNAVGGKLNSQHKKGQALDLVPQYWGGLTNKELFEFIKDSLNFDELIMENGKNGWIHVSFKRFYNRKKYFYLNNQ